MLAYLLMLQTKSSILCMQIFRIKQAKKRAGDGKLLNFSVGLIDLKEMRFWSNQRKEKYS